MQKYGALLMLTCSLASSFTAVRLFVRAEYGGPVYRYPVLIADFILTLHSNHALLNRSSSLHASSAPAELAPKKFSPIVGEHPGSMKIDVPPLFLIVLRSSLPLAADVQRTPSVALSTIRFLESRGSAPSVSRIPTAEFS